MSKQMLVVVPYRNREEHLAQFLENAPRYFDRQGLTYDILLCELDQQGDWNAGLTCNSLVDFAEDKDYEWLYIHHVDVWPTGGQWEFPRDKEIFFNLGDYGSCLMKLGVFREIGGYSNSFWGWGGEDNDLYAKAKACGYECTDRSEGSVKYDTGFQNHERKFNGRNYANGLKLLYTPFNKNDITDFREHGSTRDLCHVSGNIYKQTVVPKKISPDQTRNKKLLITFSQNQSRFENVVAYVKSASIYSAYEYDIVVVVADEEPDDYYVGQIEAHGAKVFRPQTQIRNLFVDRFKAYKEFLELNPDYEYVLHTDFTDVYFQDNPFQHLDPQKLTLVSEGVAIKDQTWNTNMIRGLYEPAIVEKVQDRPVLCGGVIGAPREIFLQLVDKLVEEYEAPAICHQVGGVDQICLMKSIYHDGFLEDLVVFKGAGDPFCVNLHVFYAGDLPLTGLRIGSQAVLNGSGQRFSIVHQFNRFPELYNGVVNHFCSYFAPVS